MCSRKDICGEIFRGKVKNFLELLRTGGYINPVRPALASSVALTTGSASDWLLLLAPTGTAVHRVENGEPKKDLEVRSYQYTVLRFLAFVLFTVVPQFPTRVACGRNRALPLVNVQDVCCFSFERRSFFHLWLQMKRSELPSRVSPRLFRLGSLSHSQVGIRPRRTIRTSFRFSGRRKMEEAVDDEVSQ